MLYLFYVHNFPMLHLTVGLAYVSSYRMIDKFRGSNFRGLGNSDNFVGLYFCGVPPLIT